MKQSIRLNTRKNGRMDYSFWAVIGPNGVERIYRTKFDARKILKYYYNGSSYHIEKVEVWKKV